ARLSRSFALSEGRLVTTVRMIQSGVRGDRYMDRRDFLKATGSLIAAAPAAAGAQPGRQESRPESRIVLPINRNWRFSRTPSDAARGPRFDDMGFERVVVPHTNVRLP